MDIHCRGPVCNAPLAWISDWAGVARVFRRLDSICVSCSEGVVQGNKVRYSGRGRWDAEMPFREIPYADCCLVVR